MCDFVVGLWMADLEWLCVTLLWVCDWQNWTDCVRLFVVGLIGITGLIVWDCGGFVIGWTGQIVSYCLLWVCDWLNWTDCVRLCCVFLLSELYWLCVTVVGWWLAELDWLCENVFVSLWLVKLDWLCETDCCEFGIRWTGLIVCDCCGFVFGWTGLIVWLLWLCDLLNWTSCVWLLWVYDWL
jgi:hypothetical protein